MPCSFACSFRNWRFMPAPRVAHHFVLKDKSTILNNQMKKKKKDDFELSKPNSPDSMMERTKRGRLHKKVIKTRSAEIDEHPSKIGPAPFCFPSIPDSRSRFFFFIGLFFSLIWVLIIFVKLFSPYSFYDFMASWLNEPEVSFSVTYDCVPPKSQSQEDVNF